MASTPFIDPYIGKDYRIYTGFAPNTFFNTEVTAMGIQYMYLDPIAFAKADPDHFAVIWNALKGR